jgi:hypothetical protein
MLNSHWMRAAYIAAFACLPWQMDARAEEQGVNVRLRLIPITFSSPHDSRTPHLATAVVWLKPVDGRTLPFPQRERYVLLQKNRMFIPHILVVSVGSAVLFPNADPFFHNVFSLFDGKRFDLGLYEAGSTKETILSREGISYIFCNIHPEMSAVVLSLSTPLYIIAASDGAVLLHNVPPGEYELHFWVEGAMQPALNELTRRIHVGSANTDLGDVTIPMPLNPGGEHDNKFGQPYDPIAKPVY